MISCLLNHMRNLFESSKEELICSLYKGVLELGRFEFSKAVHHVANTDVNFNEVCGASFGN